MTTAEHVAAAADTERAGFAEYVAAIGTPTEAATYETWKAAQAEAINADDAWRRETTAAAIAAEAARRIADR